MAVQSPTQTPDYLLTKIRQLLDQYLAMGSSTPVAPQAQQLADAIDQAGISAGPGADNSLGMGPDMGGLPGDSQTQPQVSPESQFQAPEATDQGESEPPPNKGAKSYGDANVSALARLKNRNKKGSKGR